MTLIALILAVFALSCCVYLWLELQKKPSPEHLRDSLRLYSEELSKTYAKQLREIEAEWADMYSKFMRLAGRMDKEKGLASAPKNDEGHAQAPVLTRSDLIRQRNRGGVNNVKNVPS